MWWLLCWPTVPQACGKECLQLLKSQQHQQKGLCQPVGAASRSPGASRGKKSSMQCRHSGKMVQKWESHSGVGWSSPGGGRGGLWLVLSSLRSLNTIHRAVWICTTDLAGADSFSHSFIQSFITHLSPKGRSRQRTNDLKYILKIEIQ